MKGKARKQAHEESKLHDETPSITKYTITTKDLIEQAQVVAGRVEIPGSLERVLERAIQARQRCAEWFQTSKVDNQYSNEGHQHFIAILEQTLDIIRKRKAEADLLGPERSDSGGDKCQDKTDASWQELANRFQDLAVEEPIDAEELDIPEGNLDSAYELEEESEETRMSLMIFCFFEDMHRLQDFLHGIWKSYRAGQLDLMTSSFITNAAIDIVRQNEEEILAVAPKLFSKKLSYKTIAIVIFYADALSHGQDPQAKMASNENLRPTPFDDFIYLSTAKTLMKFDYLSAMAPRSPDYPLPSFPLRASYVSRPELLGNPYMDNKEKEDALLSQLMMDLDLYDLFCNGLRERGQWKHPVPAEDELSSGLRKLRKDGALSVWLVFASRLFLDVQEILGSDIKSGKSLLEGF